METVISHEIRIPMNQPVFHGMSCQGFVSVAHLPSAYLPKMLKAGSLVYFTSVFKRGVKLANS